MLKEQVKHHFIPQCYLRNFSENGKFVFVYSKKNRKKGYAQPIDKTACIDYFYRIPEKYLNQELFEENNSDFIEKKVLAENIEWVYSKLLNKIILAGSLWIERNEPIEILTKIERQMFAALIAIQYLRMPNIRDMHWAAQRKIQKERDDIVEAMKKVYGEIDCTEAIELNRDDDYAPVLHSEIFLDEELIAEIQDQIIKKIWVFKISSGDTVYTSDNPILMKSHLEDEKDYYDGFGRKGVEIIFPLSKNIILTIWDEQIFSELKMDSDKFSYLTKVELLKYNCIQYICANDELYCQKNDFEIINLLKIANGGLDKEITVDRCTIKVNGK